MTTQTTYPMTLGQLSVWRDIEKMPRSLWWEGNLFFSWTVPAGRSTADVWQALGALGMRHASLRTTYVVDNADQPGQRVSAETADAVVAAIRQPGGDDIDPAHIETVEVTRPFTITEELPWRAWVSTDHGEPRRILIVIHHMAADGAGLNVMERDFFELLAGGALPEAPQPAELAVRQRSGTDTRLAAAAAYWRKTLAAAPRVANPPPRGPVLRATMHTGIPEPILREAARRIGVSVPTTLLTAYCRALCRDETTSPVLLYPMSSNRFDKSVTSLVTSMNQWVPLLIDVAPGEPFEATARRVHLKSMVALGRGVYDPDAVADIRREVEREGGPVDPGYHFTFLLPPMNVTAPEAVTESRIEWHTPLRTTGPAFYLMARAHDTVALTVRVIRDGYPAERLTGLLDTMREALFDFALAVPADAA